MKIHQRKMGCATYPMTHMQRSDFTDKTSENQGQDATHSAEDIQAGGPVSELNSPESNFHRQAVRKNAVMLFTEFVLHCMRETKPPVKKNKRQPGDLRNKKRHFKRQLRPFFKI